MTTSPDLSAEGGSRDRSEIATRLTAYQRFIDGYNYELREKMNALSRGARKGVTREDLERLRREIRILTDLRDGGMEYEFEDTGCTVTSTVAGERIKVKIVRGDDGVLHRKFSVGGLHAGDDRKIRASFDQALHLEALGELAALYGTAHLKPIFTPRPGGPPKPKGSPAT